MTSGERSNLAVVRADECTGVLGPPDELNAQNNALKDHENLGTEKNDEGILIKFPENMDLKDIKGTVFLYRPSNKELDFELPINLSQSHLLIPDNRLLDGRWDIKIFWEYQGEAYLFKEKITYGRGK